MSWLVAITHAHLWDELFYVYCLALFGAYAYGLLMVTDLAGARRRSGGETLALLTVLTVLHNETLGYLVAGRPLIQWWQLSHWGVAEQEIFGHGAFQASSFGMLLPLSIALGLAGRFEIAAALAALVADVHVSYWLASGALTAAYVVMARRRDGAGRAVRTGLIAALVAAPAAIYVLVNFVPTSSDLAGQAASVLAHHVPQETLPGVWLGTRTVVQGGIVAMALVLVWGTDLFLVLAALVGGALMLTVAQILSGSLRLAVMFPWRASVLFVPLSTAVLASSLVTMGSRWRVVQLPAVQKIAAAAGFSILAALAVTGMVRMTVHFGYFYGSPAIVRSVRRWLPPKITADFPHDLASDRAGVFEFVSRTKAHDDVYLVPTDFSDFRLRTGAPIVADWTGIAYKDVEVLDWAQRYAAAQTFFASNDCSTLPELVRTYAVSHVVFDRRRSTLPCAGLERVYADERYTVFRVDVDR